MANLSARADAAYDNTYHHKLRGRIWRALEETPYADLHDTGEPPGFVMSNPFPPHDMKKGDERTLLFASHDEGLLTHIARDLLENRELNIGDMPFHVDHVSQIHLNVGEPGRTGVLETGTGLLVRIPPWRCDDYSIEHPGGDTAVYWRPEHTAEPLIEQLEANLDRKHQLFCPEHLPGPTELEGSLFDEFELIKTFAMPVTVTEGQTQTMIFSKWRFRYTVRNDHHRRHLNLALDCGLGERNSLGFGFVNLDDKRPLQSQEGIKDANVQ